MKMKTKLIIMAMVSVVSVSSLKALPACTDCQAVSDTCYAAADTAFDGCIDSAQQALDATLAAINQAEADAISACDNDFDAGGIAHSACVGVFRAAASAQAGAARVTYQVLASLCRSARNTAKSQCDLDYVSCTTDVAVARANCECE